jgi:hypothetical protein
LYAFSASAHPLKVDTYVAQLIAVCARNFTARREVGWGFRCTFDVKVSSRNIGASMYDNISFGWFYKESGKWRMRPPFSNARLRQGQAKRIGEIPA